MEREEDRIDHGTSGTDTEDTNHDKSSPVAPRTDELEAHPEDQPTPS